MFVCVCVHALRRTPVLSWEFFFLLKLRRWCSGIMQDSHSCDPGSIPGRRNFEILKEMENFVKDKRNLPDGELNPGLPRDRRGSLPLDYQGLDVMAQ